MDAPCRAFSADRRAALRGLRRSSVTSEPGGTSFDEPGAAIMLLLLLLVRRETAAASAALGRDGGCLKTGRAATQHYPVSPWPSVLLPLCRHGTASDPTCCPFLSPRSTCRCGGSLPPLLGWPPELERELQHSAGTVCFVLLSVLLEPWPSSCDSQRVLTTLRQHATTRTRCCEYPLALALALRTELCQSIPGGYATSESRVDHDCLIILSSTSLTFSSLLCQPLSSSPLTCMQVDCRYV